MSAGMHVENNEASLIHKISQIASERGVQAFIVGGWVRDKALGKTSADIDIASAADAQELAEAAAKILNGKAVLLDDERRIARVAFSAPDDNPKQSHLDFSTLEGTILEDLARRDFTINAMAIKLDEAAADLSSAVIIDPFGGQGDIKQKLVRAVSPTVFTDDPIRLLRAVRFSAVLGFNIEPATEENIRLHASSMNEAAGERIREELLHLLGAPGTGGLRTADRLNLLTAIFTEMAEAKGVTQPAEHHWDVFEHSLRTVQSMDFVLQCGSWEFADESVRTLIPWSDTLAAHFQTEVSSGSTRRTILKLAAFLHDVRKPQTKAPDANGRIRFLGHAQEGAETAAIMLERLRFSTKEIRLAETEIRHHLRPTQLSNEGMPTRRAIYRYFRDTGDAGIDILFLSLADHLATRGPGLISKGWQEHTDLVRYVMQKYFDKEKMVSPPKLIDGYDIINFLRIPPGKEVGEMLETVRESQAAGEVNTREEALSLVARLKEKNAEKK